MASVGSYALCQTACNSVAAACYAGLGFVFGTVTVGAGTPAAVAGCNAAQGTCMSACAAKFFAEGAAETAATGGLAFPGIVFGGLVVLFSSGKADTEDEEPTLSNQLCISGKSKTAESCSF